MNKKLRLSSALLLAVGLTLSSVPANAVLVWTIVDPVRDMNWYVKEVKRYLIATEKYLASIDKRVANQLLTRQRIEQSEANASAHIIAQTTANSITRNNAAEERYRPLDKELVCSTVSTFNRLLDDRKQTDHGAFCSWRNRMRNSEASKLTNRFNKGVYADGEYYRNAVKNIDTNNAKDVIRKLAKDADFYSKTLNEFTLINEEDLDRLTDINELVFMNNVILPNPIRIHNDVSGNNVDAKFNSAFFSKTYQSFTEKQITDRSSHSGRLARDALLIESNQRLHALSEDIANAEFKDDALRMLALTKSKQLVAELKKLELALHTESAKSLELKAIIKRGYKHE
ncbi:hypothetical protein L1D14_20475 [Vibrio tubiashii]|uniref:hypothetical protein n=1 Tax=Vibrio tubiashii TaxID=29498 RepID=UPI001EFDACBE|nr:hypothetical protein [Vibrio tubiashii]MCG9578597.1 hypothetical protein [Vibrio tubiashii]